MLTDKALIFLTTKFELYPQKTIFLKNVQQLSLSTHVDTMIVIHQREVCLVDLSVQIYTLRFQFLCDLKLK